MPWLERANEDDASRLDRLGPPTRWWASETPRGTADRHSYQRVAAVLGELILDARTDWALDQLFARLPEWLAIAELPPLGTRARNALGRTGAHTLRELAVLSPRDLLDLPNVGHGTVVEILAAIVQVSVRGPLTTPTVDQTSRQASASEAPRPRPEPAVPAAHVALLADLAEIARWRHLRGQSTSPLLIPVLDDAAPEQVLAAQDRLADVTAADILPAESVADPADELDAILFALPDRERFVLARRLLAPQPDTLATISEQLGLSRERVRQIEQRLHAELLEATAYGSAAGDLLGVLRTQIRPVTPLDRLTDRYPVLARQVTAVDAPLWLVLDRLDAAFEVDDGWAAAPTVREAVDQTRQLLEDLDDAYGLVPFTVATQKLGHDLDRGEMERWLTYCGFEIRDDHVLTRIRSIPDRATAVLALAGTALAFDELVDRLRTERNPRSIRNALFNDSRFNRVDRDLWALADWGLDSYTGIRSLIGQRLDAHGGEVKLDVLVDELVRRFTVSERSVLAYASSAPYEVRDSVVRYRTGDRTIRKDPCATRRLYRSGDGWLYRLAVTNEHLRGSGFPVPGGVASVVGCQPGRSVTLTSPIGDQPVRWTGPQPAVGSIRRHLEHLAVAEGDLVFLRFGDASSFDVFRADPRWRDSDPLARALALVGADPGYAGDVDDALDRIATAVCLPPKSEPATILNTFRDRGGTDVYDLLVKAWNALTATRPASPAPPTPVGEDTSRDVMRMLGYG